MTIDLETTAGQGTNLGYRFEHLQAILQRVRHPERLGICVDTCHIFAAGYSLETEDEYDEVIERLDRAVALKRVRVWHVNDSGRDRGSRVDRHAAIGAGCMGLAPFRHLVNDPRFRELPLVLETPKGIADGEDLDVRNLRVLRGLVRKAHRRANAAEHARYTASTIVRPAILPPPRPSTSQAPHSGRGGTERTAMSINQYNGQPVNRTETAPLGTALDPSWFINRELSWLDFNERVLEEARDPSTPLLERLRFLAICASNLDEFFEVRVAGLQAQLYENLEPQDPPPDGMGPLAQLIEISRRAHDYVARMYEAWHSEIRPELQKHGIRLCTPQELTDAQNTFLDGYFDTQVYPVLTPLAIDPAHPFPHVHNKSLNLLLRIESKKPTPGRSTPCSRSRRS